MEPNLRCPLEEIYMGVEKQDVKRSGKEKGAFQTKPVSAVSTPTQGLTLLRFDLLQSSKQSKLVWKSAFHLLWNKLDTGEMGWSNTFILVPFGFCYINSRDRDVIEATLWLTLSGSLLVSTSDKQWEGRGCLELQRRQRQPSVTDGTMGSDCWEPPRLQCPRAGWPWAVVPLHTSVPSAGEGRCSHDGSCLHAVK